MRHLNEILPECFERRNRKFHSLQRKTFTWTHVSAADQSRVDQMIDKLVETSTLI